MSSESTGGENGIALPELEEIRESDYTRRQRTRVGREAVFFFTPMCGTCKLAERMLRIALASGISVPVTKLNINFAPVLRERWQISSVPCLALVRNGQPERLIYAMQGVGDLYHALRAFDASGTM